MTRLPVSLRIALRELRGGLRGFVIFLACLALGVAAIAAVQSLSRGLLEGLRADGRAILGGDVAFSLLYRLAPDEAVAALDRHGTLSVNVQMRTMARREDAAETALVELKAVDGAYPLYGRMELEGGAALASALAEREGRWGAVVEPIVLERLGLAIGDPLRIGMATLEIRAAIAREPDRAGGGDGFAIGPRVMVSRAALDATGLIQPGSLVTYTWALRLDPGAPHAGAVLRDIEAAFPDLGWRGRTYDYAAPQIRRFVHQLTLFLTLVGLTALLVGAVGVANAVRSNLDEKIATIATLKCLGARADTIFQAYIAHTLLLALIGIAVGLALGALAPVLIGDLLDRLLPIRVAIDVYPDALGLAALFGLLTAAAAALWPIGRAQQVPAAALFRDRIAPAAGRPPLPVLGALGLSALLLAGLALAISRPPEIAAWFVAGAAATTLGFALAAALITRLARAAGRPRWPMLRLALANLHRPGAPTGSMVLALGLGLTVLVGISQIEGNLARSIDESIPDQAPAFFFVDIQDHQLEAFRAAIAAIPGTHALRTEPSLRGRIARVNGQPAEAALANPARRWVISGDRGVSYAAALPPHNRVLAGAWWPADTGQALLSISDSVAEAFAVGPGDRMTIDIAGVEVEAQIANIRTVDWDRLQMNFTLVFSPPALAGAPAVHLGTVEAEPEAEAAIQRLVARDFPNITAVRVREALDTVAGIIGNIGIAVRAIAAVTLAAGTLVLAGAIAAGHRRRVYDAVVLKVLGATRASIAGAFLIESGLIGFATALIAIAVGTLGAWAVVVLVMELDWRFFPGTAAGTALIALTLTLGLGFAATWRALGQKAAPLLRNE